MSCRGLIVREVGLSLGHLGGTLAQTAKEALAEGLGQGVGEGGMVGGGAVVNNLPEGGVNQLLACGHDLRGVGGMTDEDFIHVSENRH